MSSMTVTAVVGSWPPPVLPPVPPAPLLELVVPLELVTVCPALCELDEAVVAPPLLDELPLPQPTSLKPPAARAIPINTSEK
jgi:hypothetical protein